MTTTGSERRPSQTWSRIQARVGPRRVPRNHFRGQMSISKRTRSPAATPRRTPAGLDALGQSHQPALAPTAQPTAGAAAAAVRVRTFPIRRRGEWCRPTSTGSPFEWGHQYPTEEIGVNRLGGGVVYSVARGNDD